MTGHDSTLSDRLGQIRQPTAEETARALAAVMRAAHDDEDAARLRAMLFGGDDDGR